jgi:MFS family permease
VGWSVAPERVGTSAYAALLRDRGMRRLLAGSQAGRLSFSMMPLSLVLFGTSIAGSPAAGGGVFAAFAITSTLAPVRARLVDRNGPRVLAALVGVYALLLAALAALGALASTAAPLIAGAALAGLVVPPLGPFTRAVAGAALRGRPGALQRAYALDSAAEEASLVLAPVLVALLVALWSETAALLVAAALVLLGGLATARCPLAASLPTSESSREGPQRMPAAAWLVIASLGTTGAALGAVDVAVPAITRAHGHAAVAGVLLAVMAAGTAAAALLAGLPAWRRAPLMRLALLQPALALAFAACALVEPLPALAALLALPGAVLGIIFVTAYVAIEALAPARAATRTFAWLVTANNAGLALGAALAGALADRSPHAALWPAAAAPLAGAVLAAAAATRRQPAR